MLVPDTNGLLRTGLLPGSARQLSEDFRPWYIRVLRFVTHETGVTYRIVYRDLSASLIPATLFALAALHATQRWSPTAAAELAVRCFVYFGLYIYCFCLSNQIVGYEEDRLNKPDRALPSGLISMKGALQRWWLAMIAFPAAAFVLGGWAMLGWAVAWQLIFVSYNHLGLDRHWFTKNVVFITFGSVAQLGPAWQLAAPLDATGWRWVWVVAVAFGLTLNLQDLRDVEGDRAIHRRTLPMVLGEPLARMLIAGGIAVLPVVTHFGLVANTPLTIPIVTAEIGLAVLNIYVAVRTIRLTTARADHKTYMWHTYWFCGVLASAWVIL